MKKIVYFDMDNVLVDFPSAFDELPTETLEIYKGHLDQVPGIFSLMKPKEGALEAFGKISEQYDTYILSTAPWKNPSAWSDKLLWVQKYLGDKAHKRLILSHNKHLNIGDYLIDDRLANGVGQFQGQHIHFGSESCKGWDEVLAYLHMPLLELESIYSFELLVAIRKAWLEFDPIDVLEHDNPIYWGEYDCYLNSTLDLLQDKEYTSENLISFLKSLCEEKMATKVTKSKLISMMVRLERVMKYL